MSRTLKVMWTKQGTIQWEDWYLQRYGPQLQNFPGLKEHISFANYDLSNNGLPMLEIQGAELLIRNVDDRDLDSVRGILDYHGFKVIPT